MSCAKSQIAKAEGKCKGESNSPMKKYRDGNNDNNSMSKQKSSGSSRPARMGGY